MKKSIGIALAAGALVVAYPASSWFLGQQIESSMNEQYAKIDSNPFIRIIQRDFQRGIFSSTETVSIEFLGEALKPLKITLRSEIKHGPIPGGTTLAAAVADSELIFDEATTKQLSALFGDKKPLQVHTVYRFDRGGVATLSSPGFSTVLPAADGEAPGKLDWDGITMTVDFARDMASYTFQADAPKVDIVDEKGGRLLMSALHVSGDQKRIFDDEPMLYAGTQKFSIGQINASTAGENGDTVSLKNLSYEIDMPVNGEFLDLGAKIGAEVVQVGKKNFGPAHYDISLHHLHARTVAKLHHALLDLYADPAKLVNAANNPALFAPLGEPARELLKHGPEISIDRFSFNSPHGEMTLAARARINDMKPEDLNNPFMLLGKLQASAEMSLPEALIGEFSGQKTDDEAPAGNPQQQLAALVEQGFITQEKGFIRSKLEFTGGQLTVNGKPFNPMAMGGGAGKKTARPG